MLDLLILREGDVERLGMVKAPGCFGRDLSERRCRGLDLGDLSSGTPFKGEWRYWPPHSFLLVHWLDSDSRFQHGPAEDLAHHAENGPDCDHSSVAGDETGERERKHPGPQPTVEETHHHGEEQRGSGIAPDAGRAERQHDPDRNTDGERSETVCQHSRGERACEERSGRRG